MFSQAHLQKNTHKKVFSLVEISNIYYVFLLRNANIFKYIVWYKICVTCMNFLAFLHSFIFVFSRFVCFHVVVDKLKQFEPAHDAVTLNSFAVIVTL